VSICRQEYSFGIEIHLMKHIFILLTFMYSVSYHSLTQIKRMKKNVKQKNVNESKIIL